MSAGRDAQDDPREGRATSTDPAQEGASTGLPRALTRLVGVVLLTLLGLYVARVAGLVVTLQRAAIAEAGLAEEVDALRTEVASLETAAVEAGSDAYVERWAREERTMSRPGDRTIEVVETQADTPPADEPADSWLRRLRQLFGRDAREESPPTPPATRDDATEIP